MKLLAFAASHRDGSFNRKLAWLAAEAARSRGMEVDFAEYSQFDTPVYDDRAYESTRELPEAAQGFIRRMSEARGIIISMPEYNWSYPGSLKNLIDWVSRAKPNPLSGRAGLLLAATPSPRGGAVGLTHLKVPLEALGMVVYPEVFALGNAFEAFDASGHLVDPRQQARLVAMLEGYLQLAAALPIAGAAA